MKIVLATRNAGKIREIREILSDLDVEILDSRDFKGLVEPAEDGETFLENALAKARSVHEATGLPALADDSGIEVDALGGGPGVRSARYGGAALDDRGRWMKLLSEMERIPEERRGARFRCVAVLYPAPATGNCRSGSCRSGGSAQTLSPPGALATEGFLYGRISAGPAGLNGFGYDPVFYVSERGKTVAEMTAAEKNGISHRYRAFLEMKWLLIREHGVPRKEDPQCSS